MDIRDLRDRRFSLIDANELLNRRLSLMEVDGVLYEFGYNINTSNEKNTYYITDVGGNVVDEVEGGLHSLSDVLSYLKRKGII
mgnify:CR=1 FL=1